jgi:two-component system cell cycle sensor histidine kinase/response regulator CckA
VAPQAVATREPRPLPGTPPGDETVLVVEDEESVRRLITSILELNGYTVLAAGNATEAIEIGASHAARIDLLLTDIDMPDIHGRELAQRIRAARVETRLLYMSGRDASDLAGYGIVATGTLFLPKPFTPYGLAWRVREVLDAPHAA